MAQKRPGAHGGRTHYYIQGEGFCDARLNLKGRADAPMLAAAGATEEQTPPEDRAFLFCRMFGDLERFTPDDDALIELGLAMQESGVDPGRDTEIPAGFTYFGQFVDHDITLDTTAGFDPVDPTMVMNGRTPALDLDNVYGLGPDHPQNTVAYEADKLHLKIGLTTGRPIFDVLDSFPNDLPRKPNDGSDEARKAEIGDPRNDENLIVAQTHLAMLKFHNKIVDTQGIGTLAEAQRMARQHYQSVVLHDFIRRIVDTAIYDDVMQYGRKFFLKDGLPASGRVCMPVEFSVAAYRQHSMVRNAYEWNRIFSSTGPGGPASLPLIFEFSFVSQHLGLWTEDTVPSDWIVRWQSMHDFSDIAGVDNHEQFNFVRKFDTHLAEKLGDLPEFRSQPEAFMKSLAARNLLRGKSTGLPTGQAIADRIGVTKLTPNEVRTGPHQSTIDAHGFAENTPLWYYILKEAEVQQNGERLGAVGSRILVETFHALVEGSSDSIFSDPEWKPSLPSTHPDRFTMADLLVFVDDLNPLG